ncbi:unnamed protein product [Cunninghamella echinulata]
MKKNQRSSVAPQKPNHSTLFHYAYRFDRKSTEQPLETFEKEEIEQEKKDDHLINNKRNHYVKKKKIPPPPVAPSIQQIDIVRYSWERVCQLRLDDDDPHMSPVQGFGSQFYKALFETDEFCKEKFNHNVMLQARVLASIIAFLTRSPSIKGKSGSIQDINATKKLNEYQPPSPSPNPNSNLSFIELIEQAMDDDHQRNSISSFIRRNSTTSNNSDQINNNINSNSSNNNNNGCPFQHHTYDQFALPPSPVSSIESEKGQSYMDNHHQRLSSQEQQEIENYILKKQQLEHDKENQFFAHKLKELGASHLKYNLLPYHFDAIGPALITALKSRLKNDCVSHVENAWSKVYEFTAYYMKVGLASQIAHEQENQFKTSMSLSSSINSLEAGDAKCTIQ